MNKEQLIGKIKNFWYYHKWHALVAVFLICATLVAVRSCQNKENPDLYLLFAREDEQLPWQSLDLEAWLSEMTEDVNGDGETTALVLATSNHNAINGKDLSAMLVQVNSGNAVLYMLTEETYSTLHQNGVLMDLTEFAGENAYVEGDRYLLSASGVLEEFEFFKDDETVYYLAIRKVNGTSLEDSEKHQTQLRLAKDILRQLIENE